MSVAVRNAHTVVPLGGHGPVRGDRSAAIEVLSEASVVCDGDRVVAVGDDAAVDVEIDATGCTVVPGFVDPHTHLPFFGWRADEDAARLSGTRYEDVHGSSGGIYRSARMLSEASDDDVLEFAVARATEMLRSGTTTFETKSGYGLSTDGELRQLRLARRLAERVPQTVVSTCLAAHAVPEDRSAGEWIGEVAQKLLPAAVDEGLATACDIYIESIAFALEHAARLAESAGDLGLTMRVHADQLEDGQAGSFAARWGFGSADHLNHTSTDAAHDIAASDTTAVLLPGATFTLRQNKKPPARTLLDAGAIVALGTDLNPGTSPVSSMAFVIALAARLYGMLPFETLAAATVNAAFALGLDGEVGRIVPGHRADLVILDVPDVAHIAYRADRDPVAAVVCGGEVVYVAPGAEARIT